MKLFCRISVLALAVVMVCLFSVSAFATTNHDYYVHQSLGDMEDSHAFAVADIEKYETRGYLELSNGALLQQYLYIKLDHRYIDAETGYVVSGATATRTTTTNNMVNVAKEYNSTIIRKMVDATYTFDLNATNLSHEPLVFDAGPATIRYNGN